MRKYMQDAAPRIRKREYFRSPSLSCGTAYDDGLTYIVRSYSTPIAIFTGGQWYLTRERFSRTTSTQQSALRQILSNESLIELDADEFKAIVRASGES